MGKANLIVLGLVNGKLNSEIVSKQIDGLTPTGVGVGMGSGELRSSLQALNKVIQQVENGAIKLTNPRQQLGLARMLDQVLALTKGINFLVGQQKDLLGEADSVVSFDAFALK